MRITVLGVPIDAVTRKEAGDRIGRMLDEPRLHIVTTPNPEMLVAARKDARFRAALGRADLAVPDGFGLLLVARSRGTRLPERVTGTDLVEDIAALASARAKRVFFLGGTKTDVAARAARKLAQAHPGMLIAGAESGGLARRDAGGQWRIADEVFERIRQAQPDVLFVAFGHGKQEEWIVSNAADLPSVRVAMGVGGAFDFIAGDVRRAPAWMRRTGLEWLWRLLVQPWRIGRIFTAVVVFPFLALIEKR